jgi:glycosyltransferase involved in cell wall biosynthesis
MKKKTILILVSDLGSFISNRLQIAKAAKKKGYIIHVAYFEKGKGKNSVLIKNGLKFHSLNIKRGFSNPFKEMYSFYKIFKLFKIINPNLVHLITIKPYLYGGIISRLTKVDAVLVAVAGMGSLFITKNLFSFLLKKILFLLFKISFSHSNQKIILQNLEDKKLLVNWKVLKPSKAIIFRGSGVNLNKFKYSSEIKTKKPIICFIARLIYHKGIIEFINAAKLLKKKGVNANFWIVGDLDKENPSALKEADVSELKKNSFINFKGYKMNIVTIYRNSHIICLPSYREGLSLTLIQAAAAGRAVVTTNVAGCRDAIIPNKTGYLVPVKNSNLLAKKLEFLIKNYKIRNKMGRAGRKLAEKHFDINKIVNQHLNVYDELLFK